MGWRYDFVGMKTKLDRWAGAAAISCGVAVALGAFGAHGLGNKITSKDLEIWKTAAHYHLIHSVVLVFLGFLCNNSIDSQAISRIRILMWVGMLIFAGTLYGLVLSQIRVLGAITPLGGASIIASWIWLGLTCFTKKTESS
jgi:uncharacterized membrane protein YgdD (TMEM256/DUF423 family)